MAPLKAQTNGFSLVEILITLGIIGVLTAFTIPSLFNTPNSTLSSKQTAMAKDTAYMVLSAYEQYKAVNPTVTTGTTLGLLTPYMNYVSVTTSGGMDDHLNASVAYNCASITCLKLHNGGTLFWNPTHTFGGTATTNGIFFFLDPDSQQLQNGGADGATKSLCMWLYYNGTIKTRANTIPNTYLATWGPWNPGTYDPSWFTGF